MPRLTDASREARRDAIADAALRVLRRQGVARTSVADIVDELGGSAGGVYSHFASKAEILRFIAARVYGTRIDALLRQAEDVAAPTRVLRTTLEAIAADAPVELIVQLWGDAAVDAELRAVVLDTLADIESAMRGAVLPWCRLQPGDADARAGGLAVAMRGVCQGYIAQRALFGGPDPTAHLAALGDLLDA